MAREDERFEELIRRTEEENRCLQELMQENDRLRERVSNLELEMKKQIFTDGENGLLGDLRSVIPLIERQLLETRRLYDAARADSDRRREEFERLARELERHHRETSDFRALYEQVEARNSGLINLFVTLYRLHDSFDRADVLSAINETLINLLGTEDFAVYEIDPEARELRLISWFGIEPQSFARLPLDSGPVGEACRDGKLLLGGPGDGREGLPEGKRLQLFVPFRLGDAVIGGAAIFSLLPQKEELEEADRELLELLSAHAASALHALRLHEQSLARP